MKIFDRSINEDKKQYLNHVAIPYGLLLMWAFVISFASTSHLPWEVFPVFVIGHACAAWVLLGIGCNMSKRLIFGCEVILFVGMFSVLLANSLVKE